MALLGSYVLLVLFALYHHHLGHLRDPNHPLTQTNLATWLSMPSLFDHDRDCTTVPPPSSKLQHHPKDSHVPIIPSHHHDVVSPNPFFGRILSRHFVLHMLLPLMSAVMTCPVFEVGQSPTSDVLE